MNIKTPRDILRYHRRTNGFTQREFARLIGVKSRSQLSRIERGKRPLTVEELIRSRILFNIPLSELIPVTWRRVVNGLWEDIRALTNARASCSKSADTQCTFLKHAEKQVEQLEESNT